MSGPKYKALKTMKEYVSGMTSFNVILCEEFRSVCIMNYNQTEGH